jgi:hypothetical protein
MMNNGLTAAQYERLVKLIEECSEVIKVACKIQLHGYASVNPYEPEKGNNLQLLIEEMGDYDAIMHLMILNGDIDAKAIHERHQWKYSVLPQSLKEQHTF